MFSRLSMTVHPYIRFSLASSTSSSREFGNPGPSVLRLPVVGRRADPVSAYEGGSLRLRHVRERIAEPPINCIRVGERTLSPSPSRSRTSPILGVRAQHYAPVLFQRFFCLKEHLSRFPDVRWRTARVAGAGASGHFVASADRYFVPVIAYAIRMHRFALDI